jgi:hypothetical protein|uniref:Uncharacterized protein n=1 Tax=Siphoviridae sp. ctNxi14 TaxID=2825475 RepID=A0A8S5VHF6_9CAUD|nr:MAG TPA: hypothetical protein [Siphoviridae sp. ctNxi14]
MSYQKQNFANGEVLTAPQLNHIEDGIVDLESNSSTAFAGKADKTEVQANAKSISDETTRAQTAESALSSKITEETERAKAAEQANADGIAAEASRAKGEEQRLDTAITAETTRAEQAEQALDTRTAALESCGFVVVDGKVCMKYVKS